MKKITILFLILTLIVASASFMSFNAADFDIPVYGDLNNDGYIDDLDAMILNRHLSSWVQNYFNEAAADLNGDGSIDDLDDMLIVRYLANWDIESNIGLPASSSVFPIPNSSRYFHYKSLLTNSNEIDVYNTINEMLGSVSDTASIENINSEETLSKIFNYVLLDHPEYFHYLDFNYAQNTYGDIISISITYHSDFNTPEKVKDALNLIAAETSEILYKANSLENDYLKVKLIYDYLNKNFAISTTVHSDTIYGGFIENKASSNGFSEVFCYLLNKQGFKTIVIKDNLSSEWAMVKLDDEWYHFDPYAEKNLQNTDYQTYNFFSITTEQISLKHTITSDLLSILPLATATEYNYFIKNNLYIDNTNVSNIKAVAQRSLSLTPNQISLLFSDYNTYNHFVSNLTLAIPDGYSLNSSLNFDNGYYIIYILVNSDPVYERYNHYKSQLTDPNEIAAYEAIDNMLMNVLSISNVNLANAESLSKVMNYVILDRPEYFHIPNSYSYGTQGGKIVYVTIRYDERFNTKDKFDAKMAEIDAEVAELIAEAKTFSSEYEKVVYIYDYLKDHITYTYDYEEGTLDVYSLYGAIVKGKAVCEGYAEGFGYLLNKLNIQSIMVTGESQGVGHKWAMAQLDGEWYHFDPTWDDPSSSSNLSGFAFYNYFAVTTAEITVDHDIDDGLYLPLSTATINNYFVKNGLIINSINQTEAWAAASRSLALHSGTILVKFTNTETYNHYSNNILSLIPSGTRYTSVFSIKDSEALILNLSLIIAN